MGESFLAITSAVTEVLRKEAGVDAERNVGLCAYRSAWKTLPRAGGDIGARSFGF